MPLPWWIDVIKTIAATFIGASLAFLTNLTLMKLKERSDREAHGNLAVLKLAHMIGHFEDVKSSLKADRARLIEKVGSEAAFHALPLWMQTRGLTHVIDTDIAFDFENLVFLLDDEQKGLIGHMYLCASKHRIFFSALDEFRAVRKEVEARLEKEGSGASVMEKGKFDAIVGPRQGAELHDLAIFLNAELPLTICYMEKTVNDLSRALKRHFKNENALMKLLVLVRLAPVARPRTALTTEPEATHSSD